VDNSVSSAQGTRAFPQKGLFVIGCARSGTTVLQDALNDSKEVFLFGEPDFHTDPGTPDFARRYNAMHRAWRNQPTKSTFCPPIFEGDAPWREYLWRMGELYRYVGAKVVLNPMSFLHDPAQILEFYSREFYASTFIFTFRNPLDVARSAQELQAATGGEVTPFELSMASYVVAISLFLVMLRNLPHVHAVFHDNMGRRTFARLEKILQIRLPGLRRYYDQRRVRSYDQSPLLREHGEAAQLVVELYRDFRQAAIRGFDLVQLGQNNGNSSPAHLTTLGQLARRCEAISQSLGYDRAVIAR